MRWGRGGESRARGEDIAGGGGSGRGVLVPRGEVRAHVGRQGGEGRWREEGAEGRDDGGRKGEARQGWPGGGGRGKQQKPSLSTFDCRPRVHR